MDKEKSSNKMGSSNVGSESMALQIDLNETPVSSPREGDDDCLSRGTEASVSVCSVCRRQVPAQRGAVAHPGWMCLGCLLNNDGSCSTEGGRRMESFDINAPPPLEVDDDEVVLVAMDSRNDRSNEASTSFHPFPPSKEKGVQESSIAFGDFRRSQLQSCGSEKVINRDPCPPGKLLSSRLPSYLMGDALQVWELASRFFKVLGLGEPLSFPELVSEVVSPWLDNYMDSNLGQSSDTILAKIHCSLLKLLVSELLSKSGVYGCPDLDNRESKSRQGKMKDSDCLAVLKKRKIDMLPVNGFTWHEVARRYIIALMTVEGNLEPTEIASVKGKIFHCLHGDGGILSGSLTGIAALEGDAVVLRDAMTDVFGSLQRESDTDGAQAIEVNNDAIPEWAQVLEPVRDLQANVGARIRKCIYEALERNPPEWAREKLEHSISKEVYKPNASGPTKKAIISVLEAVSSRNPRQKKETIKIKTNSDLIDEQCRTVLRRALAADERRVFCTLVGKTIFGPKDNDGGGHLGYPAMVSRPLDFRTIDIRLAAGVYGGSHEAFIDDVREVRHNIRTAYADQSDLVRLAENLSQKLEELYEKEVLSLVNKLSELSNINGSNVDAVKERDILVAHVIKNSLPPAPWDKGICKVCGVDKDEDKILSCNKCSSEYHGYCLSPPLQKIPKGDWYCPSCVAGQSNPEGDASGSVAIQCRRKRRKRGHFMSRFLEDLAQLASLLELKECWEVTVEERMSLMKFLFEEALNSATIRDHMDQCVPQADELQHKLRSLTSELKLLKFKEEMLVINWRSSLPMQHNQEDQAGRWNHLSLSSSTADGQLMPGNNFPASTVNIESSEHETRGNHGSDQADVFSRENSLKKKISDLQDSIASVELELMKVCLRKEFLGRDSNGRAYWAFYSPGARPWIVANGSLTSQERASKEFAGIADSVLWMYYESDDEIQELLEWLTQSNEREKELRESILQLQSRSKDKYPETHVLSKGESNWLRLSDGGKHLSADFLTTKAMTVLEKRNGLCLRTNAAPVCWRCECLELLWPSKDHCPSCHQSFATSELLMQHFTENCEALMTANERNETTTEKQDTNVTEMPSVLRLSKRTIINESSVKPVTGRASEEVLRLLKTNLLDIDAALPEDALRISRSHQERRLVWRSFVKSAKTVYEMVQATIILEDTIKSEYLHSNWWYWSSPSTAAKITTLSALALRIYTLDSTISYEKPFHDGAGIPESSSRASKRRQ